MQFSEPDYRIAFTNEIVRFWIPSETTSYHKGREMAMQACDTYSRCGISREVLSSFAETMIEFANKQLNVDTLRTDLGVIANNIKYRLNNIVDEQCALRMGAIACFIDGEDPNQVSEAWTQKKLAYAANNPDVHAFFLDMGIAFTPEYVNLLRGLTAEDYLKERAIMLDMLTLKPTPKS